MQRDIRDIPGYADAAAVIQASRAPGSGQISDAQEIHASPNGRHAVFSGTIFDTLEGLPPTRICQVDLASGDTQVLTFGPNTDRLPKYSPDGRHIGFLSDRHCAGDFQFYLFDTARGGAGRTPSPEGCVPATCGAAGICGKRAGR